MMIKAKIGSLKVNVRHVLFLLLTFAPISNAATVYRCIDDNGVLLFSETIISGKKCIPVAETKLFASATNQWIDYPKGSFGNATNPVSMSFKIRDNKNPLWPSIWTKSTFINASKPKDEATELRLWNVDCSRNKIAFVQGQNIYKDGTSSSSGPFDSPTYRYAVPDTSDEDVINIACK